MQDADGEDAARIYILPWIFYLDKFWFITFRLCPSFFSYIFLRFCHVHIGSVDDFVLFLKFLMRFADL
jgi:hypothetical protein